MSSSELDSKLIKAEKDATAKVQADALHFKEIGKSMDQFGYVGVDMNDTVKIGKQVENLRDEAVLLGQERISIEVDATGHAQFADGKALKSVKTNVEDMKTTAQGQMTLHKADHDASQRNKS